MYLNLYKIQGDSISIIQTASVVTQLPTQSNQPRDQNQEKPDESEVKYEGPSLENVFISESKSGNTYTLHNVMLGMSIDDFRAKVASEKGIDTEYVRLIYAGKQLGAHCKSWSVLTYFAVINFWKVGLKTLRDYGLHNVSQIRSRSDNLFLTRIRNAHFIWSSGFLVGIRADRTTQLDRHALDLDFFGYLHRKTLKLCSNSYIL
jgi:hypothetical protein